jgi:pyruvate,water dikinase
MTAISVAPASGVERLTELCVPLAAATEENLVGGKAYALGRLIRAGVAVPQGFVVASRTLDEHRARAGEEQAASTRRRGEAEAREQQRLLELPLGIELRQALAGNATALLAHGPVVVRSSAVGEDGATESFAGQLESVLHVGDEAQLESAVRTVWASLWSERVASYRKARGLPVRGMGIIVQRQIDARAAGVMFTATSSGEMLVEYAAGIADKLVAGEVDPGRVAIDRLSGASRVLRRVAECTLGEREVEQLRRIGLAVEAEFGAAQDVEWAIDRSGVLYVVQSRPITAPVTIPLPANGRRISWSNANVNENFPRPISPLLYSIAAVGYTHYFRNLAVACGVSRARIRAMEPAFQRIIGVHGARMYYNLTSIHSVLHLAPFGDSLTRSFDAFVGADGDAVDASGLARPGKLRQAGEVAVIAARATTLLMQIGRRIERFERTVDDFAKRSAPARLEGMSLAELRELLAGFIEIRCHKWLDASLADGAAMISYGALERLLRHPGMGASVHTSLLKAIPNVVSGEPVLRLWDLSRLVRSDSALNAVFDSGATARAVLDAIETEPRFAEFRAALQRFLDEWGFRCSEELMLTTPSFQEDPAPLVDILRVYVGTEGEPLREAFRAQVAERERQTRAVGSELGLPRAVLLNALLPRVHAAIRYRERARLKQALLYSRCRRIALAMGRELARTGTIAERDDVFFFTWQELVDLTGGGAMFPGSVRSSIAMRKAEHARLSATRPPDAFTLEEGEYLDDDIDVAIPSTANAKARLGEVLYGTSACGGRVSGRATVLESVTQASLLARGDVLVTRQTDPGWGPVFPLISGLVIERGGMLSHGAIIAREFGIPCVVGVKDAMRRIPSGTTLTVDGDRGGVHVVA